MVPSSIIALFPTLKEYVNEFCKYHLSVNVDYMGNEKAVGSGQLLA